jgi:hypothetical protein
MTFTDASLGYSSSASKPEITRPEPVGQRRPRGIPLRDMLLIEEVEIWKLSTDI